jgi:hypothetical protein
VYVLDTLAALMHTTRAILCGALDALQRAGANDANGANGAAAPAASRGSDASALEVAERYCDFWYRLGAIATAICGQIAHWLLAPERMRACAVRFDSDVLIWSHLLYAANNLLIAGRCASMSGTPAVMSAGVAVPGLQ